MSDRDLLARLEQQAQRIAELEAQTAADGVHALERMAESMERALPILGNIAMHLRSIQKIMETAHEK